MGVLQPGHTDTDPAHQRPPGTFRTPPLVGCLLPDGHAAVFPGGLEVCARLHLPEAAPG